MGFLCVRVPGEGTWKYPEWVVPREVDNPYRGGDHGSVLALVVDFDEELQHYPIVSDHALSVTSVCS